jgi:hypothetical protein
MVSSVSGRNSLFMQLLHFILNLSHLNLSNSFLQTGEYPDFPVFLLSHLLA